jgi:hypothetical protein
MIRPFTLITMLLAALAGAYLFAVKHQAQVLDDEIAAYSQAARLDVMRIRVLQGQWSMETDPTRLQKLAAQFTSLQPMQPAQLITLAALKDSLPPPGSTAPESNPALPEQTAPAQQNPDALVARQDAPALPLPPPPAPVLQASLTPAPAVENRAVPHRVSHSALHLASTALAESLPPPKPFYPPVAARAVQPVAESSALAQNLPVGAQVMPVKATGLPQFVPPVAASQDGGSALGMASNLPPPQPMPQNGSDN